MWLGQAISEAGSAISALAFPLLALAATGSAVNAGMVATTGFIANLIGQIPAGHLADTMDKRKLLIGSDLVRAGCLFAVAVIALGGWYRNDVVMALTALNMAAFSITGPAQQSTLRAVVSERTLAEASALIQGRTYAVDLGTPALSGLLFALCRALPFGVDAVSFLYSAGCTARIRTSLRPLPGLERPRFALSFARGWTILWQNRLLRWTALYSMATNLVFSTLVYSVLLGSGGGAGAASGLGATVTIAGLAGLLGSAAGPYVQRRLLLHRILMCSCLIRTVSVIPAVLWPSPIARSLTLVVVMFTGPIAGAALGNARLLAVRKEVLGIVSGANGLLATCMQPIAPLAAGVLLQLAHGSITFAVLGVCFLAMAVGVLLPPSLRIKSHLRPIDQREGAASR